MITIVAELALVAGNLKPAVIKIHMGKITEVTLHPSRHEIEKADFHADTGILSPGLIDLQINGCFGADFASASIDQWRTMLGQLPKYGVTAIAPTVITAPVRQIIESIERAKSYGVTSQNSAKSARVLGFHVEGPYLSHKYRGAHNEGYLKDPDITEIDQILNTGVILIFTLAPERKGSVEAIRKLADARAVVSIGHTDAGSSDVRDAVAGGARMVTHLYNAQRKPTKSDEGLAGFLLEQENLHYGLIVDLIHVPKENVKYAFDKAADRVVLVSDAVAAMGMPSGEYLLGDDPIVIRVGDAARRPSGVLAGSTLTLDEAISNCISCGIDPVVALTAATRTPADLIGRKDLGRIEIGAQADLVWLDGPDSSLRARKTWIAGEEIVK